MLKYFTELPKQISPEIVHYMIDNNYLIFDSNWYDNMIRIYKLGDMELSNKAINYIRTRRRFILGRTTDVEVLSPEYFIMDCLSTVSDEVPVALDFLRFTRLFQGMEHLLGDIMDSNLPTHVKIFMNHFYCLIGEQTQIPIDHLGGELLDIHKPIFFDLMCGLPGHRLNHKYIDKYIVEYSKLQRGTLYVSYLVAQQVDPLFEKYLKENEHCICEWREPHFIENFIDNGSLGHIIDEEDFISPFNTCQSHTELIEYICDCPPEDRIIRLNVRKFYIPQLEFIYDNPQLFPDWFSDTPLGEFMTSMTIDEQLDEFVRTSDINYLLRRATSKDTPMSIWIFTLANRAFERSMMMDRLGVCLTMTEYNWSDLTIEFLLMQMVNPKNLFRYNDVNMSNSLPIETKKMVAYLVMFYDKNIDVSGLGLTVDMITHAIAESPDKIIGRNLLQEIL